MYSVRKWWAGSALQVLLAGAATSLMALDGSQVSHTLRQRPLQVASEIRRNSVATSDELCLRRRRALETEPALPGAPNLESLRAEVVARAKAEPVLFLWAPLSDATSTIVKTLRERLYRDGAPWQAFAAVYARFRNHPRELRQVLLTDGYLYAEQPAVAALLGSSVALSQLYTEPEIVVTRGSHTLRASRKSGEYFWTDGPEIGTPARLWLFDRVTAPGATLSPAKHVSLAQVREQTGASQIEIERLTMGAVLVQLVYGDERVPAVLTNRKNQLVFDCEVLRPEIRSKVEAARELAKREQRVLALLRASIDEEVSEALPFDEPKTEEGQQDGKLRQEWKTAYLQGHSSFEFNGDRYSVFGTKGRPKVPQVCVDFILDSWERMADTRWLGRAEGRGRKIGHIDFDALDIENRRSVDRLIDFARIRPDWFELLEIPEAERVTFADRRHFFRRLFELRADYQPGDVVAILGLRDDNRLHYHSFFIVANDPITRMPTLLAANAGRPRLRSWEAEMQNAPRRSIVARIRPRLAWLESIANPHATQHQDQMSSTGPL